jgi:hypothetical protein
LTGEKWRDKKAQPAARRQSTGQSRGIRSIRIKYLKEKP